MGYTPKNYNANGGDELVVGGKLTILDGADLSDAKGILKAPAANQPGSTATTVAALKDDLNTLLAALKTAGLMEADATGE